jgi:acyl dehydratase
MAKIFWEDFATGQIKECGRRTVSAEEIKAFAAEFDPQPMHLDEEAARATLVGGLCASGWHTCAIMMRIVADGLLRDSSSMGAPGVEEVRWLAPVRPNDTLSVRATVLDTKASRSRPSLGFVDTFFEVLNEAGTCVMTVRCNLMFARREPTSPASLPA